MGCFSRFTEFRPVVPNLPLILEFAEARYTLTMDTKHILSQIDAEIATLQQARALLTGTGKKQAGRPKSVAPSTVQPKRTMSPEARARIAEAQKKRWAAAKKAAK
jgi:hypothetical protein